MVLESLEKTTDVPTTVSPEIGEQLEYVAYSLALVLPGAGRTITM